MDLLSSRANFYLLSRGTVSGQVAFSRKQKCSSSRDLQYLNFQRSKMTLGTEKKCKTQNGLGWHKKQFPYINSPMKLLKNVRPLSHSVV
jgi:hypothetical protein